MKILVTGAAGFSGGYLIEALAQHDLNDIYAVSRDELKANSKNLKWSSCNLLNRSAVDRLISSVRPQQIYHLAAYSSPGDSFQEPIKAINETLTMQINIFETCIAAKISPRLLLVSSGQIYGKSTKLPLNERSAVDCSSPYAVAKLGQENLANYYSKRGFEIVIARPFNHIGPRQRLGFLVSDLAHQIALAEKMPNVGVVRVGNLSSKRDFTDVRDIALAYIDLLKYGEAGEIYNICSGQSVSGQEILNILLRLSKNKISVETDPNKMRPSDIPDLYGDYSKLRQATGWRPKISLKRTLQETLDFWRKQI